MAEALQQGRQRFWRRRTVGVLAPILSGLAAILAFTGTVASKSKETRKFKYAGGMQLLLRDCRGGLELKNDALTFRCPDGTETVPYTSIEFMEYRPSLSSKVRKLNIRWEVSPAGGMPIIPKKRNRFFVVIYSEPALPSGRAGNPKGLVLEVPPETMQPYIAEIELKSGKRVEVYSHEDYY
jgi:hypothetical protein